MKNGAKEIIKNASLKSIEDILKELSVDKEKGLSDKDVQKKLKKHGPVYLKNNPKKVFGKYFFP